MVMTMRITIPCGAADLFICASREIPAQLTIFATIQVSGKFIAHIAGSNTKGAAHMSEHLLVGLSGVLVLGMTAQWLAWRLRLPSILLLLLFGFIAGPVTGFIHPDELLGDVLFPVISLSVGIIMFEGGLSLKLADLRGVGRVIRNLITVGALVTWALCTLAARYILHLDLPLAVLLSAILVVTGPTVIGPLLRHVRPGPPVGTILRWEGILIDPVGATLALLVFEVIVAGSAQAATTGLLVGVAKTLLVGIGVGALGAELLYAALRRYLVPDYMENAVTLMVVVGAFALSGLLQPESGLLAVTVMGIILGNQTSVPVKRMIEFKESLGVLLIGSLFILLSARLRLEDLTRVGPNVLIFIVFLVLIVRPVAVGLSTLGSGLSSRQRIFLAFMAPRGIVAAATASIFALRLSGSGYAGADQLVPIMFLVIVATVAVYGLGALPLARWLGIAEAGTPQGVLIVGAHAWARAIGQALQDAGIRVLLVDTNYSNVQSARMEGLPIQYGNILAEEVIASLRLDGIGRLLALTPNDEVNALATIRFAEVFGRAETYQLALTHKDAPSRAQTEMPNHMRGRLLDNEANYAQLDRLFEQGAVIKATPLTATFDMARFRAHYGITAIPLFLVDPATGHLAILSTDVKSAPQPDHTLISVVIPPDSAVVTGSDAQPAAIS
jgi:NhaP-type Na+/H+ or K+/H+ antiporter